ncbi:AraC family transcriptional regulator N-terminal domain-containing protein [Caulobacter segnis]
MHDPSFCVLAQGRKRILVGDAAHEYDDCSFFLSSIDVPSGRSGDRGLGREAVSWPSASCWTPT